MIRGLLMFRTAPDYQRDLMLTGPLIFIGPLTVERGPVFLAGPDGQRAPDCPDSPRVPENPRRAHTLSAPPPPLGYVPGPEGGDLKLSSRQS